MYERMLGWRGRCRSDPGWVGMGPLLAEAGGSRTVDETASVDAASSAGV